MTNTEYQTLNKESLIQKLIELATAHLTLRECHSLAVAALKDPERTTRLMNLHFTRTTLTEEEMVERLRGLKRDLETVGLA